MRTITGTVVSNKMKNTIIVRVDRSKQHPKYKKSYKISKKFYADAPNKQYALGDEVTIYETRPLSKLKRWTTVPPQEK